LVVPIVDRLSNGQPALNKFAAIEDWDRTEWSAELAACDEAFDSANFFRRHRSTWELVQMLYAARRASPVTGASRAWAVLSTRSSLPVYLSRCYRWVQVTPAGGSRSTQQDQVWPYPGMVYDPDRIRLVDSPDEEAAGDSFDLIALLDNAILADGITGFVARLEQLDRRLANGGVIIFAAEVVIAGGRADDRLPGAFVAAGSLEALIARYTGLRMIGEADWHMSPATLDRLAIANTPSEHDPHFVIQIGKLFSTTAVWVLCKQAATSRSSWGELAMHFSADISRAVDGIGRPAHA
jgi:hypothetical protein